MRLGVAFLLVFTPLAFGAVEPWSVAILEIVAFGLFGLHVASKGIALPTSFPARAVLALFSLLVGLALLQMLPLPAGALGVLSPAALELHRTLGAGPPGGPDVPHALSVYPDATRDALLKLLAYAAVFFVVAADFRSKARIAALVKTILFMGGLLCVLAIVQKATWNGRILWFYPVQEYLRSGAGIWGPFVNRNHFAGYLEMAIPLGLGLLVSLAPDAKAAPGTPWIRRAAAFLASARLGSYTGVFLLVLLMTTTLLATLSRGGVTACALSTLFFAWIIHRRRSLRRRAAPLALAGVAIALVALVPALDRIGKRFEDMERGLGVHRLAIFEDATRIARDFPLVGTGFGTFEQVYGRYQSRYPGVSFDHAHNDYLELATDAGLAGFLAAMGMAAIFFVALARRWRKKQGNFGKCIGAGGLCACVAIAIHSATDFNLHIPANALLLTVIAALTHAAIFTRSGGGGEAPVVYAAAPRPATGRRLLRVLGAVPLTALLVSFPCKDLIADYHYRRAPRLTDDPATEALDFRAISGETIPSYREAIASLEKAAALAPRRSSYPQAQADLYRKLGVWASTLESLHAGLPAGALPGKEAFAHAVAEGTRAVLLEPTNATSHLALAELYAQADRDLPRADAEIRKALAANPMNTPLRHAAAMQYLLAGKKQEAREQAEVLARIDDSYVIPDSAEKTLMIERRTAGYEAKLTRSYLFAALDIAFRATEDMEIVKGMVPRTPDAQAVLDAFLESKGMAE